jgi:hypothetical protein
MTLVISPATLLEIIELASLGCFKVPGPRKWLNNDALRQ